MAVLNILDVLRTKRDGGELSDEQIEWFIDRYTAGEVADEQASALLMAIVWRSMSARELDRWTAAMVASGNRLDLSAVDRPTVDKHSTGGVGDKISLPLCPLVAACGAAVPQLAGTGPRPHRWDPRQARVDSRVAVPTDERRDGGATAFDRRHRLRRRR